MEQRRVSQEELNELLRKHKLWLEGKEGGERLVIINYNLSGSNLRGSNLRGSDLSWSNLSESDLSGSNLRGSDLSWSNLSESDLSGSNLTGSDLSWSNLRGSNLRGSDLTGSDLRESNLDFSALPLWCGSLAANFDDRQLIQIAYHLVKAGLNSTNASEETKAELAKLVDFANKFHRVEECGMIEIKEKE